MIEQGADAELAALDRPGRGSHRCESQIWSDRCPKQGKLSRRLPIHAIIDPQTPTRRSQAIGQICFRHYPKADCTHHSGWRPVTHSNTNACHSVNGSRVLMVYITTASRPAMPSCPAHDR